MGVICTEACLTFQGPSRVHRTPQTCDALPAIGPYLRLNRFQGANTVKKKRELFPGLSPASSGSFALPPAATSQYGNFNPFPFRWTAQLSPSYRITSSLRIDLPMSNCCSHGTFLHFSLQSSHLNICYYHQDLH